MKKVINKLEQLQAILEVSVLDREETFDNRSEKWQESEKGEEYQELTNRFQEMYDEVTDWIDELNY